MNKYQRLTDITRSKYELSKSLLELTLMLEKCVVGEDFDSTESIIDKRQDIIDDISLLDEQFVTIFEEIKLSRDFAQEIVKYPDLARFIADIKDVIAKAKDVDEKLMPILSQETEKLRHQIKESRDKRKINDRYSMDNMQKVTKDNFGIFIDEKQ